MPVSWYQRAPMRAACDFAIDASSAAHVRAGGESDRRLPCGGAPGRFQIHAIQTTDSKVRDRQHLFASIANDTTAHRGDHIFLDQAGNPAEAATVADRNSILVETVVPRWNDFALTVQGNSEGAQAALVQSDEAQRFAAERF